MNLRIRQVILVETTLTLKFFVLLYVAVCSKLGFPMVTSEMNLCGTVTSVTLRPLTLSLPPFSLPTTTRGGNLRIHSYFQKIKLRI